MDMLCLDYPYLGILWIPSQGLQTKVDLKVWHLVQAILFDMTHCSSWQ